MSDHVLDAHDDGGKGSRAPHPRTQSVDLEPEMPARGLPTSAWERWFFRSRPGLLNSHGQTMTQDDNEIFPSNSSARAAGGGGVVVLEFTSFRDFIDRYSARISDEGLFIVSERPPSVGESVTFEVRLSDDFRLMKGRGTVVWRVLPGTPAHESGMAIRFEEIDEPSRRLITRLVNNYRGEGGTVFDLTTPPEAATEPVEETGTSEELFVTDPIQKAPSPSGNSTDELFGESPFQVPAGPETIALPRDLVPSVETSGLESLIQSASAADEPLHPIGPLDPPEPVPPPVRTPVQPPVQPPEQPITEPELPSIHVDPGPAAPSADFVEETVPEIDEDFVPSIDAEPAVLPEIAPAKSLTPPAPASSQPPAQEVGELEPPSIPIDPVAAPDLGPLLEPDLIPGPGGDPSVSSPAEADVSLSAEGGEIPLAPPEVILEPPTESGAREPSVPEVDLVQPTHESSESLAPPEISGEIPQGVPGDAVRDVEMPEAGEMDEDYATSYAASAATSGSGPGRWLWIGLCIVAVVLGGIAAVRYQDHLRELMPWLPGGDRAMQTSADRPSLEELRARLLGEKETDAAPAAATGNADAEEAEAESPSDEAKAGVEPEAIEMEAIEAEATAAGVEDRAVDPAPTQVVADVDPPSDATESPTGSPIAGPTQSAGRVESIDWTDQNGSTVVNIATAGLLSRDSFDHVRVSQGSPREVIKVFGVTESFPPRVYEVGSGQVIRLRTGSHSGGEVHIVADLADDSVRMSGIDVVGKTLRVTFSR